MALGQHLKELRTRKGLSQAELAKRVGIDVTYLSKLENDRQRASERVVRLLADALEMDPGLLLIQAGLVPTEFQATFEPSLGADGAGSAEDLTHPRRSTAGRGRRDRDRDQPAAASDLRAAAPPAGAPPRARPAPATRRGRWAGARPRSPPGAGVGAAFRGPGGARPARLPARPRE